jgi:hypothetical protein
MGCIGLILPKKISHHIENDPATTEYGGQRPCHKQFDPA